MRRLKWAGLLGASVMLTTAASVQAETITNPPTTNLPSPTTSNVSGYGWAPNSTVAIHQCTVDLTICKLLTTAPTDPEGSFGPVEVTVTRAFTGDGGEAVDCDVEECALVYIQDPWTVISPISFGPPSQPPPPTPPLPPATVPTQAGAAATGPPETFITQGMKRSETGRVRFRFTSDEADSTFECKLKGEGLKRKLRRFRDCSSPRRYKNLDDGRFSFKVRAVDAAGNVDPTPAKDRFRVVD